MWLQQVNYAGSGGNLPLHGCNKMTVEEEEVDKSESKQVLVKLISGLGITMFHIYYVFVVEKYVCLIAVVDKYLLSRVDMLPRYGKTSRRFTASCKNAVTFAKKSITTSSKPNVFVIIYVFWCFRHPSLMPYSE